MVLGAVRPLDAAGKIIAESRQLSNSESYAICKADTLIKGQEIGNIIFGNTLSADDLHGRHFDYMLQSAVRRGVEEDRGGRATGSRAAASRRF